MYADAVRVSERARVCSSCALFGLFADTNIKWRFVRDREKRDERKRVLGLFRVFLSSSSSGHSSLETRTKRLSHITF